MASTVVNLKVFNKKNKMIVLSDLLLEKLEINQGDMITLFFGMKNVQKVKVFSIKSNKPNIFISSDLKEKLFIPYLKKIMIKKEGNGLRIGPLVGILTTDFTGRKFTNITNYEHPFSLFFKDMLSPESTYPLYYFVFTPNNVNWTKLTIKGFFYVNNSWKTLEVPLPDVIYNRVPNRTIERKAYIKNFKMNYKQLGGKLYNFDFFNKWDIYNILINKEKAKEFIPETYTNPDIILLSEMLNRHPIVYLKPTNGSLGLGVYKIYKGSNGYIAQFRYGRTNKAVLFKTIPQLYRAVFSLKNQGKYLIQQGIELIEYDGSPVDFRIHLHKNQSNDWEIVAIGAKAAGKGSVTTHLRTGGKLLNANKYLEKMFNNDAKTIINSIKEGSIEIAKSLEEHFNTPLGELGLDIGIDKKQKIWLFEVNSKPGRSIFKHPSLKKARMESNKKLIEYSIFLSDF